MTMMTGSESVFRPDSVLYRPAGHFFRSSLGRFATGVAVVTYDAGDHKHGITVNSFTSVSMDPPLVLASIGQSADSYSLLHGRPFTINVLGAEQRKIALHFAGKPNDEPEWVEGEFAPRLAGALSYFECTPWAEYDGGDHTLFVGRVEHYDYRSGDALGFVNGQFTILADHSLSHEDLF